MHEEEWRIEEYLREVAEGKKEIGIEGGNGLRKSIER